MPREAKLFDSSSGSVSRGFLKFRANIPPMLDFEQKMVPIRVQAFLCSRTK